MFLFSLWEYFLKLLVYFSFTYNSEYNRVDYITISKLPYNQKLPARYLAGIGAVSGGGATSKLLQSYGEPWRDEVLDYLFLPHYGAALQILKVEMGGDAQSTDGTECSHMHSPWDEDYSRGYEWWLMKEAKKRNPSIRLATLPWGFPSWLGSDSWWPFANYTRTSMYMINWIKGAQRVHNLTIDYVGHFRKELDSHNLSHVQIVAADLIGAHAWQIADEMLKDKELFDAVQVIGAHYPDSVSSDNAQFTGKPLWSSEDYSAPANDIGAACIARLVNRNFVNGFMTSTLAWNMIASYYDGLPIGRYSLMIANQPWSGYYEVSPPIWAVAHTTHFTSPGWIYLPQQEGGAGFLSSNGSFVCLISADMKQITIVIENINVASHDVCVRGATYSTEPVNVTVDLNESMSHITELHLWSTQLTFDGNSEYFQYKGTRQVVKGSVSLFVNEDSIHTLTTVHKPHTRREATPSPPAKSFPVPFSDNFEDTPLSQEGAYFSQQVGAFEVQRSPDKSSSKVLQQMILEAPIHWCPTLQHSPLTLLGDHRWSDIGVSMDTYIPSINGTNGIFLALHIDRGGCYVDLAQGVYLFLLMNSQSVILSGDLARTHKFHEQPMRVDYDTWYHIDLAIKSTHITASVNNTSIYSSNITQTSTHGFVGLGADTYGLAVYDNFNIYTVN